MQISDAQNVFLVKITIPSSSQPLTAETFFFFFKIHHMISIKYFMAMVLNKNSTHLQDRPSTKNGLLNSTAM